MFYGMSYRAIYALIAICKQNDYMILQIAINTAIKMNII